MTPRRLVALALPVAIFVAALAIEHTGRAAPTTASLFWIERSKNANIVQYDANLTASGACNTQDPIAAYWVMHAEDGRREALTRLERELAYGFTTRSDDSGKVVWVVLVAHRARPLRVICENGTARAEIQISGRRAYLTKLYVQATNGLMPRVEYVDMFGTDAKTGAPLRERKTP